MGFPLTEFLSFGGRYSLSRDKITLDQDTFYTNGECDPLKAGKYICDEIGKHTSSVLGWSTVFDNTDGIHPTRGRRIVFSQDLAGLGGDVKYLRSRVDGTQWRDFGGGWIFSLHGEGGYIHPGKDAPGVGQDAIRLNDRFFGPQLRGFDIRGIGPRVQRVRYDIEGNVTDEIRASDALGGRAYYMGRAEMEIPVSSALKGYGLRPSAFIDIGSLWKITKPELVDVILSLSKDM